MQKTLTIATRKSPLALWQAYHVRDRLQAAFPEIIIELLEMTTQGDERLDVSLTK
ncbi:MAG: hydroxymethylbilane synthase, partial [Oceanospirillales bacterium]|nr:hydroxymethylbilane synthase [Oceanospirillales bacterium]